MLNHLLAKVRIPFLYIEWIAIIFVMNRDLSFRERMTRIIEDWNN